MATATVIGAGVSGLTTAHELLRAGYQVRVVAEKFTPDTTSDVSAAMWWPFHAEPVDKVLEWCLASFDVFQRLAEQDGTGVVMRSGTFGFGPEPPQWADRIPGGVVLEPEDVPTGCASGLSVAAPMIEMNRYMPWLQSEIVKRGAELVQMKVASLAELANSPDVLVNASGLGARELANDEHLFAARGHVVRFEQAGIETFIGSEAGAWPMHVFPRRDDVVVGGSYEPNVEDLNVSSEAENSIVERAVAAQPLLRNAKRLGTATGLRPSRFAVRLEAERVDGRLIVHNYGHGGSGVTVSWGCAADVVLPASSVERF